MSWGALIISSLEMALFFFRLPFATHIEREAHTKSKPSHYIPKATLWWEEQLLWGLSVFRCLTKQ